MSTLKRFGPNRAESGKAGSKTYSPAQEQTKDAFSFKWALRDFYDSPAVLAETRRWLMERYCGGDETMLADWLSGSRKTILDAGCGSGFSALSFFGDLLLEHDYLGVDISDAVEVAKDRFREKSYPGEFLQANLADLSIPDKSVDMVFSEGVLHHTDSTEKSLTHLARKLKPKGRFLFYVYKKKAVIREFTDDFVREALADMDNETAWEALKPLTRLGMALGGLNVEINVPEDIPFLGIKKGKMDLQRFFYWNICKMFYRPDYSLDEMQIINYDWFRPLNCHRHTVEEVEAFCENAGLAIERMDVQKSGITVVAVRD